MFAINRKKKLRLLTLGLYGGLWLASSAWAESPLSTTQALPEGSSEFTAEQLVNWVWQKNPGISELRAAAQVAVQRIDPAGSLDDPTFGYHFAPRTFGREGQGLNQKIEFSQKLPWPGTLAARQAVAEHKAAMAYEDVESLRLQLAATAKSAYAEWYFVQKALAIHRSTHRLLGELRSTAETRYAAGKALQQDVLQAELEEVRLKRHLLKLIRIATSVKAQINALLNRDTATHLPIPGSVVTPDTIPVLADFRRDALARHPELRRVDAKLAAHTAEVELAKKAFNPDLRFNAGYNSLWDEPDKRPIIGLSINIPLDRSKRKAVLNGAKVEVRRTEYQRDNTRTQLMGELAQAHAAVCESIDAVALYENSLLPLVQQYFQAALADYESGAGSFLSVITAEREKLATEEALERNRADVQRHIAALERWTGRPFNRNNDIYVGEQP